MKKFTNLLFVTLFLFSCAKYSETGISIENSSITQFAPPPPEQPGDNMKVFRFEGRNAYFLVDVKKGISAVIGTDIVDFCNDDAPLDLVSIQFIIKEEGDDDPRVHQLEKGNDVHVSVWDFVDFDCALFANESPLFEGTGDYVSTDNDLVPFDEGPNVNSFGLNLHGKGIHISWRAQWDGLDSATFSERVRITL